MLATLIALSAFFSSTETALMSVNRYRLRHKARAGHRGARFAEKLLERPDRLIGLILLGNNLVNFSASSLATILALRIGGEAALAASVGIFTLVVLIFAEVAPKTLAALRPEALALPAAYVYTPLLVVSYPVVWLVNAIANALLRLLGVRPDESDMGALSREELRTVVAEAGALIPRRHRRMLLNILDLEKASIEDVMIPRADISWIDLSDDWDEIENLLENSRHTRLPVCRDGLDNIIGVLHLRKVAHQMLRGQLDKDSLEDHVDPPYYVFEGTPLNRQLLSFQNSRERLALVVDEYGDLQGLVTLEDILEEIVGEFTTDTAVAVTEVHDDGDGSFLVGGSVNVRSLNRRMNWALPTDGPKTLNGVIVETLETIPEPGTSLTLGGYRLDIVQSSGAGVRTVRIRPPVAAA